MGRKWRKPRIIVQVIIVVTSTLDQNKACKSMKIRYK